MTQAISAVLATALASSVCSAQVPFSSTSEAISPLLIGAKASVNHADTWLAVEGTGEISRSQNGSSFLSSGIVGPSGIVDFASFLVFDEDLYLLQGTGGGWNVRWATGLDTPTGDFLLAPAVASGALGDTGRQIAAADLNGGSFAEAIVSAVTLTQGTRLTAVSQDVSLGTFTQFEISLPGTPVDLQVTDFDGDGRDEVWTLNSAGTIRRLSAPAGSWVVDEVISAPVSGPAVGMVIGEVSGGGLPEIVVIEEGGSADTPVHILSNPSGVAWSSANSVVAPAVRGVGTPLLIDLDYDSDTDIVFTAMASGQRAITTLFQNVNNPAGLFTATGVQVEVTGNGTFTLASQVTPTGETELIRASSSGSVIRLLNATERFMRGDVNGDGNVNIADVVAINTRLFVSGPPLTEVADANDDGVVDISDSIFISAILFSGAGGPVMPPPAVSGFDPTEDRNSTSPNFDIGQ